MLTLVSRALGAVICIFLMMLGAKDVAKTLWSWKKAHNQQPAR